MGTVFGPLEWEPFLGHSNGNRFWALEWEPALTNHTIGLHVCCMGAGHMGAWMLWRDGCFVWAQAWFATWQPKQHGHKLHGHATLYTLQLLLALTCQTAAAHDLQDDYQGDDDNSVYTNHTALNPGDNLLHAKDPGKKHNTCTPLHAWLALASQTNCMCIKLHCMAAVRGCCMGAVHGCLAT